jgi:hypothetical protein
MTPDEATILYEDVLDVLTEVGNGTTDDMLHEALNKLFRIRDEYLRPLGMFKYYPVQARAGEAEIQADEDRRFSEAAAKVMAEDCAKLEDMRFMQDAVDKLMMGPEVVKIIADGIAAAVEKEKQHER